MDRIDICAQAEPVSYCYLQGEWKEESSETIRKRVMRARKIQEERYVEKAIKVNATLTPQDISTYCYLGKEEQKMMKHVFEKLGLSARAYHKILCVARTIADLDGQECIAEEHLSEAISYRLPERIPRGI